VEACVVAQHAFFELVRGCSDWRKSEIPILGRSPSKGLDLVGEQEYSVFGLHEKKNVSIGTLSEAATLFFSVAGGMVVLNRAKSDVFHSYR